MQENVKGQNDDAAKQNERHQSDETRNDALNGGIGQNINQVNDDLDEKTSTVGRTNRGRTSGLSSKDGLTGSDYDGQVTDR